MSYDSADRGPAPQPPGSTGTPPVPPSAPFPGAPSGAPAPGGSHGMDGFFAAIRRLGVSRSSERWVGGVAGGLARRFDLDPLLVRGVVGVTMLMGFGFVLYGVAWALLPEETDGRIHLEETIRGNFDIALLGGIGMVVLGSGAGDWWFGWGPFDSGWFPAVAWTAAIAAVVVILANARSKRREQHRTGGFPPPPPAFSAPAAASPSTAAPTTEGSTPMSAPSPAQPARATTSASAHHGVPAQSYQPPQQPPRPAPGTGWTGGPVPPPPGRGWTPPPATPPTPPRPPKPVVRGPGAAVTGVVVALVLLGLAGLLLAQRGGYYDGPVGTVVLGGGVVLVGLAIILSGVRGRSSGGLTALAVIGIVVALPTVVANDHGWWDNRDRQAFSDETRVVTSRSAAEEGFSFGLGDATIDLSQVPLTGDTLAVPISGGMGDITVIVPQGAAVSAEVSAGAGDITWDVDGREQRSSGLGHDRTFTSDAVSDRSDAQLALSIDLGLGSITIEED
ncbi:MAG TPA: PspC domain-containing protein [Cellulomonas sp.]